VAHLIDVAHSAVCTFAADCPLVAAVVQRRCLTRLCLCTHPLHQPFNTRPKSELISRAYAVDVKRCSSAISFIDLFVCACIVHAPHTDTLLCAHHTHSRLPARVLAATIHPSRQMRCSRSPMWWCRPGSKTQGTCTSTSMPGGLTMGSFLGEMKAHRRSSQTRGACVRGTKSDHPTRSAVWPACVASCVAPR
jgi:hypothetical protein